SRSVLYLTLDSHPANQPHRVGSLERSVLYRAHDVVFQAEVFPHLTPQGLHRLSEQPADLRIGASEALLRGRQAAVAEQEFANELRLLAGEPCEQGNSQAPRHASVATPASHPLDDHARRTLWATAKFSSHMTEYRLSILNISISMLKYYVAQANGFQSSVRDSGQP